MADLTADLGRKIGRSTVQGLVNVKAALTLYQGMFLMQDIEGTVEEIDQSTGQEFAGVALEGNAGNVPVATGDVKIMIAEDGITALTVVGAEAVETGVAVYASDSNTFTVTSTNNVKIGFLYRQLVAASTSWEVQFYASGLARPTL